MKTKIVAAVSILITLASLASVSAASAESVDEQGGSLDTKCFEIKGRHVQILRDEISWITVSYWSGYPRKPIISIQARDCMYFIMTDSFPEAGALHSDLALSAHRIDLLKKDSCSDERGIIECPVELTGIQYELHRD